MRVFQLIGEPTTNPKRDTFGIGIYLRGGDFLHPTGEGNWFAEPYFKTAIKFWCPIPILPFVNWNLFGWKGYLGCKVYGVDSPTYDDWAGVENVFDGSQAMMFSGRLSIND